MPWRTTNDDKITARLYMPNDLTHNSQPSRRYLSLVTLQTGGIVQRLFRLHCCCGCYGVIGICIALAIALAVQSSLPNPTQDSNSLTTSRKHSLVRSYGKLAETVRSVRLGWLGACRLLGYIPHGVLWTVEHAYADPFLGPALLSTRPPLSVDDTLATYILFVRSCGSGYDGLRSHVAALPPSYTSSVFFAKAELEVCAGTSLYTTTKQLDRQIEDDHRGLVMRLFGRHQELFPRDKFTIEDYKWALCTVWSRAMDFKLPDGDSIRVLAPFADMLNHSPEVKQCHVYDDLSGNLSVLAGKPYESGDQLFINYGPIPNNRLLRLYGFVVPGNCNESYDLVLMTHPMAPYFEQKHKLWVAAGLDSTFTISLTLTDPLPRSVLRYLRIQRLHQSEFATIAPHQSDAAVEKISDSNELEVLRFLVESISDLLDGFGTQLEKLEEQLAEGFYSPGGNKWSAAHVSLGEQRVLRLTRKITEDLLAKVESGSGNQRSMLPAPPQCAKCERASVQLMRCGRCNKVMYCGRACQVAHYKEHKPICRATASGIGSERN